MYDYGKYLFHVFSYEDSHKIPLNFNDNWYEVLCDMTLPIFIQGW